MTPPRHSRRAKRRFLLPLPLPLPLPLLVAWSIFATYLLAARQVGSLFPLSIFDMYQAHAPEVAARVMVRDEAGRGIELDHLEGLSCDPAPIELPLVEERCGPDHRPLPYVLRDQQHWLDAHLDAAGGDGASGGREAVELISRAYMLTPRPGAPAFTDCVLARCSARSRGAAP